MDTFAEYLERMDHPTHRERMEEVLAWVADSFPQLEEKIAWNQPMFTDHGTFIIGFSFSKKHIAVSPEREGMLQFSDAIEQAGYEQTKELMRIPWNHEVPFSLLEKMIVFNIEDKADCSTFWRK